MLLMAPKKTREEKDQILRPLIDGALADCVRYDAKKRGMKFEVELVRILLTEIYNQKGWLAHGDDGELVFRKPSGD